MIKSKIDSANSTKKRWIIWIDGANGVGKSHVAAELAESLLKKNAEYVESDLYWLNFIKMNVSKKHSGMNPYDSKWFLDELKNVLDEKIQLGKMPIVSMSLVDKLCETELFNYFEIRKIPMIHIILAASNKTIIQRIKGDCIRDQAAQSQQIANVEWQLGYLNGTYANAIRVNTDNKSIKEIVDEIKSYIPESD